MTRRLASLRFPLSPPRSPARGRGPPAACSGLDPGIPCAFRAARDFRAAKGARPVPDWIRGASQPVPDPPVLNSHSGIRRVGRLGQAPIAAHFQGGAAPVAMAAVEVVGFINFRAKPSTSGERKLLRPRKPSFMPVLSDVEGSLIQLRRRNPEQIAPKRRSRRPFRPLCAGRGVALAAPPRLG